MHLLFIHNLPSVMPKITISRNAYYNKCLLYHVILAWKLLKSFTKQQSTTDILLFVCHKAAHWILNSKIIDSQEPSRKSARRLPVCIQHVPDKTWDQAGGDKHRPQNQCLLQYMKGFEMHIIQYIFVIVL